MCLQFVERSPKAGTPLVYGMDHEEYHSLSVVKGVGVLQNRDCLLHPQRDRP